MSGFKKASISALNGIIIGISAGGGMTLEEGQDTMSALLFQEAELGLASAFTTDEPEQVDEVDDSEGLWAQIEIEFAIII